MAAKAICMGCSMEFPNEAAFEKHTASGHQIKGEHIGPPVASLLPDGIPPEAAPTPEFIETVKRIESEALTPTAPLQNPNIAPDGSKLEIPPPKPLKLTYIYTGECETCRIAVNTLELDLKVGDQDIHAVVAFCPKCQKQLDSREVIKLDQ